MALLLPQRTKFYVPEYIDSQFPHSYTRITTAQCNNQRCSKIIHIIRTEYTILTLMLLASAKTNPLLVKCASVLMNQNKKGEQVQRRGK